MDTQSLRLSFLRDRRGWQPQQVLDVGAQQGHWTRAFRTLFPSADIFMFEADARNEPSLRASGLPYRIGLVGRSSRNVEFHTLPDLSVSQGSSIYRENTAIYAKAGMTMQLPMRTLDELASELQIERVNFIKLDVQGAEVDVLEGAKQLLATQPVDYILAELSLIHFNQGAPLADEVIAYMRGIGFGMHDLFELHYWNDQLIQIDVLFARERLLTSELLAAR